MRSTTTTTLFTFPTRPGSAVNSDGLELEQLRNDVEKRRQREEDFQQLEAQRKRAKELYNLIQQETKPKSESSPFTLEFSSGKVSEGVKRALEGVVIPSLFTKMFGRLLILSNLISHASTGAFLLTNLMYGAPEVALMAGIIRFVYVFIKEYYVNGKGFSEALTEASKEAVKTAIKFFIVYMVWTLAVALGAHLGILSGGMLPLGLLLSAALVSMGFYVACFLVDTLPGMIAPFLADPIKILRSLPGEFWNLKDRLLPAFFEGLSWTLMDNNVINIFGHIATHLVTHVGTIFGQLIAGVADLAAIALVVSGLFLLGALIHQGIQHIISTNSSPVRLKKPNKGELKPEGSNLTAEKINPIVTSEDPITGLETLLKGAATKEQKEQVTEYVQLSILLNALNNLPNSYYAVKFSSSQQALIEMKTSKNSIDISEFLKSKITPLQTSLISSNTKVREDAEQQLNKNIKEITDRKDRLASDLNLKSNSMSANQNSIFAISKSPESPLRRRPMSRRGSSNSLVMATGSR